MGKRVLIAKKRGRLAGALLGGVLAGPVGAAIGAALNSKTDYFEEDLEELARKKAQERERAHAQWQNTNWSLILKFAVGCVVFYALVQLLCWIL